MSNQNVKYWQSDRKADITLGEVKISNVAKIILSILVVSLIIGTILVIVNRKYVYDAIANPKVLLNTKEVTLSVNKDEFNYKNYLINEKYPKRYKLIYPKNKDVNTHKIGTYKVKYKLKHIAGTSENILVVHVKDTTAPEITLTNSSVSITESEKSSFNAASYISSVTDNYDKNLTVDNVKVDSINWSSSTKVIYRIKDSSGNEGTKELIVTVSSNSTPASSSSSTASSSSSRSSASSSRSSGGSTRSSGGGGGAYISGVHNVSVPQGTSFSSLSGQLMSGVHGSGYVSVSFSAVNLSYPGSYPVTFSSSDGVTKTATVTVY